MFNNLLVEKYRPAKLADMVLSDSNRKYFESIIDEIPNLLFVGTPGLGKTTLARILVNDILECQYLYINASDENGIDTIRSKVVGFSQTKSLDGKHKVVILDEADGITIDGQRALRNTMEEYSSMTRFILTANYKHKIIPAIQSRTQFFDLMPPLDDVVKRVVEVVKQEGIKIETDQKVKFVNLIKQNYPDIRKVLNTIQKSSLDKKFIVDETIDNNSIIKHIHAQIISNNSLKLRKYLIENESEFQGDYHNLMKQYLDYVYDSSLDDNKKRQYIVTISDHMYKDVFVLDKEINAFACWVNLEKI
jgi:DNA polymerase III delta prime subunit|tara:strand:- start:1236 stop:2150 length:915 start_codon:yes stop_codon:yes gene_type:complete